MDDLTYAISARKQIGPRVGISESGQGFQRQRRNQERLRREWKEKGEEDQDEERKRRGRHGIARRERKMDISRGGKERRGIPNLVGRRFEGSLSLQATREQGREGSWRAMLNLAASESEQ